MGTQEIILKSLEIYSMKVSTYKDRGQQRRAAEQGKNSHIGSDSFFRLETRLEKRYYTIHTIGLAQQGRAQVCFSMLNILQKGFLQLNDQAIFFSFI